MNKCLKPAVAACLAASLAACATAPQTSSVDQSLPARSEAAAAAPAPTLYDRTGGAGAFAVFTPKDATIDTRLDFSVWNDMLGAIVFNMGPSTRQLASTPVPPTGTRVVLGHDSAYRLEGNRVFFSFFNENFVAALTEYKNDLVAIGNQYDLAAFDRNEQLAYWLNLYNALTIEQIALNYPVKEPSRLRLGADNAPFDDAKIVVIRGVPLSLRDIRVNIVYANWRSPSVIYGFFRGDIGGPRIAGEAFTRWTVGEILDRNAGEFVNALRGVADGRETLQVSRIYEEARPYYFRNWPVDLKAHLAQHLRDDVLDDVDMTAPVSFIRYETAVADLAGGEPHTSLAGSQVQNLSDPTGERSASIRLPPQVARLYGETQQKLETLRQRGWARGRVIIIDEPDNLSPQAGGEVE